MKKKSGLGRPDKRNFGVFSLVCKPSPADAIVSLDGVGVAACGKRILIEIGSPEVTLLVNGTAVCRDHVTIAKQQEGRCTCDPRTANSPMAPGAITCTTI